MPVTMDTVYFYKFNNYYNRIIKRYATIAEYTSNATLLGKQENCNFVHGDGVNSSFVWNKDASTTDTPDYVVVDDYKGNISRWFVTNSFKTRDRQDRLTLRRDLIADYWDDVIKHSPCLIRKGYVGETSPFLFNDEGVRYNKVKEEEILIKDASNCSYIVGFISNNAAAVNPINGTASATNYDYVYSSLADFPFKDYVEGAGNNHTEVATKLVRDLFYTFKFSATGAPVGSSVYNAELDFNRFGGTKLPGYTNGYASGGTSPNNTSWLYYKINGDNLGTVVSTTRNIASERGDLIRRYANAIVSKCNNLSVMENLAKQLFPLEESTYNELAIFDGKYIKVGAVIYKAKLVSTNTTTRTYNATNVMRGVFRTALMPSEVELDNISPTYYYTDDVVNDGDLKVMSNTADFYLQFVEEPMNYTTELKAANIRTHLLDQPYDMFVMINDDGVAYKVGTDNYTSNHEININMAQAICEASGTNAVYDIQIVPFNPIQGAILADNSINWLNYDAVAIKDTNNNIVGHYIMCNKSSFKLTLDKTELKFNPTDLKFDYNTKLYRLCSPNQETVFEFSPAMNGGIDTWEVSCDYRPFTSYIKVQPTWKKWYGQAEYNGLTDFRGLVYNSSLCVTQLSDAWSNYVANNKNYQQLFDNQINTLTKQNEIQINAAEETLGLRSFTGMPIGSVLRTIGGMKDIDMQKELNNVAISKLETDFKYQLDNIKAMPHTIKKLTNINEDTRIFPYIEIYSATSDEINSYNLKTEFTGYTIMTTGFITDFLKPVTYNNIWLEDGLTFIQASLINLDLTRSEETADNHMAVEIASELDKGIYIKKEE